MRLTKRHLNQIILEECAKLLNERTKTGLVITHKEPVINNGRAYSIYIPVGTDMNKPVKFILYFHQQNSSNRAIGGLKKFIPPGQNSILVVPNLGRRPQRANVSGMSTFIDDIADYLASTFRLEQVPPIGSLFMYAHSAGGTAMSKALLLIPGKYMGDVHVTYLDATFGQSAKTITPNAIERLRRLGVPMDRIRAVTGPVKRGRKILRRVHPRAVELAKRYGIKHVPTTRDHGYLRIPIKWRKALKALKKRMHKQRE